MIHKNLLWSFVFFVFVLCLVTTFIGQLLYCLLTMLRSDFYCILSYKWLVFDNVMGAPWVGEFYLLQDDHSVPDMYVQKIHYYHRPRWLLPPTPLKWAFLKSCYGWKWHLIRLRLSVWGESPTAFSLPRPRNSGSANAPPETRHHVFTKLWKLYSYPMYCPVC